MRDVLTVTAWEPLRRMTVAHRDAVRGRGTFTLRALEPERSELTWSEDFDFPWFFAGALEAPRPATPRGPLTGEPAPPGATRRNI